MKPFNSHEMTETLRQLEMSVDEALLQGIISEYEASVLRRDEADAVLLTKLARQEEQRRIASEKSKKDWLMRQEARLPAALAAYDATYASYNVPSRPRDGSITAEIEHYQLILAAHEAAFEAGSEAGHCMVDDKLSALRPRPRRSSTGDDGECGPGGDFMRAGLD